MTALTSLTSQRVLDDTMAIVQAHLPVSASGYRCQTADLWRVLLHAMTHTHSIEATCTILPNVPHPNTIRRYLACQWTPTTIPQIETSSNAALRATLPAWVSTTPVEVAIDTHDCPFYGQIPDGDDHWVCRGQTRAGTNAHYRCASMAVLARHTHLTVAITFVQPGESMGAIVERLLAHGTRAGITIKCLYADKGFCSVAVFQAVVAAQIPAIIAVPLRRPGVGTLAHGPISHWGTHTFTSDTAGAVTVRIAAVRTYAQRRRGGYELRWCLFACFAIRESLIGVRRRYRRRFGIESIYRQLEAVRIRTTATNPGLRLMLIALGFVVINGWIRCQWTYLRIAGGGPRRVDQTVLRLPRFLGLLQHAIGQWYGPPPPIALDRYCPASAATAKW
ncbi:hypothetical protein [Herpetosiphon giganteus]|jgi:hypothetical protein|uniref:hypothetical protein n=1 Tax=Herpetosiphon giganteus TaxID=2029754 RepID=UPI00195B9E51|nr:hypothetical protein [Herpetosiphon giganteus]MBM7846771.1 putative transposase [Herpetosiphon giganteus]